MAPALPSLSGAQAARAFQNLGWQVARQRGSHIIPVKDGERATLSVPNHGAVAKGTRRSPIRSAGLTTEEFVAAV